MKSQFRSIRGFLLFFLTVGFNASLAVVVYSFLKDAKEQIIAVVLLVFIFCSSLICAVIDYVRRKLTEEKPVQEILSATKRMTNGDFSVCLPVKRYKNLTIYDLIKMDINELAKELSNTQVFKLDFIANISHEIKTPLMNIQGYATALMDSNLDEKTKELYINTIKEACQKLTCLVANILKLNKLEQGHLLLETKRFNLSESIARQILVFEPLIEAKKLEVECDLEEDIFLTSEESYLEIIWSNLLSNAIKFSNLKGKIQIRLSRKQDTVVFTISDEGCGMTEEEGAHAFDKFYQADTSHSKDGNGLGLALVKKVVEVLGGQIFVESQKNVGTTFQITLKE